MSSAILDSLPPGEARRLAYQNLRVGDRSHGASQRCQTHGSFQCEMGHLCLLVVVSRSFADYAQMPCAST